jgi:hypothetical protein
MAGFSVIRTPSGGSTRYREFRLCILVTIQPLATSWQAAATGRRQQLTTKHQQNPPQTVKRSSQPAAGNRPLPAGFTLRQRHTGNILEPAPRRGTNFVADVRRDRSRAKARPTLIRVHSWFKTPRTKALHPPLSLRAKKHRRVFQTDSGQSRTTCIRVHSWFKNTPHQITPPPSVSPYQKHRRVFPTDLEPKPDPPSFVPIRGSKTPRTKSSLAHQTTPPPSVSPCPKTPTRFPNRSRAKARLTLIRVHSCSFVVQNTPHQIPLAQQITPPPSVSPRSKRLRRFPNRSRAKARTLPIREHSCPFVVQNTPPALVYRFPSVASQARPSATSRGRLHCCSPILWLRLWFCQKDRPSP